MGDMLKNGYKELPVIKRTIKLFKFFLIFLIVVVLITLSCWILAGADLGYAFLRALSVLLAACPLLPLYAIFCTVKETDDCGKKNGVKFRSKSSLEKIGNTKVIAFNKTGTVTKAEMIVTDIFPAEALTSSGYSLLNNMEDELVKIASILESRRKHPMAEAINSYIRELHPYEEDDEILEVSDFEALPGYGLTAVLEGHKIYGGSLEYIEKYAYVQSELKEKANGLASMGKTPVFYAIDKRLLGIIAVSDTIKEDSQSAIKELKNLGIKTVMLTGDNEESSKAIGHQIGFDETIAAIFPGQKEASIRELQSHGCVAMVGDGLSDLKAMKAADTVIAVGIKNPDEINEVDVAIENESITDVVSAIRLSREMLRTIRFILIANLVYYCMVIPVASGILESSLGIIINPFIALILLVFTGAISIIYALRLKNYDIHDNSADRKI